MLQSLQWDDLVFVANVIPLHPKRNNGDEKPKNGVNVFVAGTG
jgi:hypothetical protein